MVRTYRHSELTLNDTHYATKLFILSSKNNSTTLNRKIIVNIILKTWGGEHYI